MNYKIRKNTTERIFDHTISKKVIIENAYDNYHVQHVHPSTAKSVERIYEHGKLAILQYEVLRWPMFKFLKNFTKKFIVIKITSENDVQLYSIPCNFEFVSKLVVNCEELNDNKLKYNAKFYLKPLNFFINILSPLIMLIRNKGEQVRLKEDIVMWKLRKKAMDENFQDDQSCVKGKEEILIDQWFPDGKTPVTDLWNLFRPRKDKEFSDN